MHFTLFQKVSTILLLRKHGWQTSHAKTYKGKVGFNFYKVKSLL